MQTFEMRSTSPPYPDKFKPGDVAIATIDVEFTDGTFHWKGEEYLVSEANVSYYNVWHKFYTKKDEV